MGDMLFNIPSHLIYLRMDLFNSRESHHQHIRRERKRALHTRNRNYTKDLIRQMERNNTISIQDLIIEQEVTQFSNKLNSYLFQEINKASTLRMETILTNKIVSCLFSRNNSCSTTSNMIEAVNRICCYGDKEFIYALWRQSDRIQALLTDHKACLKFIPVLGNGIIEVMDVPANLQQYFDLILMAIFYENFGSQYLSDGMWLLTAAMSMCPEFQFSPMGFVNILKLVRIADAKDVEGGFHVLANLYQRHHLLDIDLVEEMAANRLRTTHVTIDTYRGFFKLYELILASNKEECVRMSHCNDRVVAYFSHLQNQGLSKEDLKIVKMGLSCVLSMTKAGITLMTEEICPILIVMNQLLPEGFRELVSQLCEAFCCRVEDTQVQAQILKLSQRFSSH